MDKSRIKQVKCYSNSMSLTSARYYKAFAAKDPDYDGVFFVGVTSTGIYCRPICTARLPKESNCQFFPNAQAAEIAGFRACKRCRPELAPGAAPVDDMKRIAELFIERIEVGKIKADADMKDVALQFELSTRQLRRIILKELGQTPLEYLRQKKLDKAKHLLQETSLPITNIAFECGFKSLRRFNESFSSAFGCSPSQFRKEP